MLLILVYDCGSDWWVLCKQVGIMYNKTEYVCYCISLLPYSSSLVADWVLCCSLAIMTDAAHLLSDVGGFAVAIFAAHYASKRSQQSHTFG